MRTAASSGCSAASCSSSRSRCSKNVIDDAKEKLGVKTDPEIDAATWKTVVAEFYKIVERETKKPFPQDVTQQLELAIEAVFNSWHSRRATDYRKLYKIPDNWGTAVNVCTMVFGNLGDDSGSGVAFTRNPNTGEKALYGEYLVNAQGEDVVAGIRTPVKIADLKIAQPVVYDQFSAIATQLETHYKDMQDLEFTVERGKLYMLQTRNGKRTSEAAVKIALAFLHEGLIDKREAVRRVDAASLEQLFHARIDPSEKYEKTAKGLNASPGAASGAVVFDPNTAVARAAEGKAVILVRSETTPDDVHGMIAAKGILTAKGGATSHAAVVARGMGKPCVSGCEALNVDNRTKTATLAGKPLNEGDLITIDGTTGDVMVGKLDPDRTAIQAAGLARGVPRARRMRSRAWKSGPTPTRPMMRSVRATWAPRASACAGPSTCSWKPIGSRSSAR